MKRPEVEKPADIARRYALCLPRSDTWEPRQLRDAESVIHSAILTATFDARETLRDLLRSKPCQDFNAYPAVMKADTDLKRLDTIDTGYRHVDAVLVVSPPPRRLFDWFRKKVV